MWPRKLLACGLLVVSACSTTPNSATTTTVPAPTTTTTPVVEVTISGPITGGKGSAVITPGGLDLAPLGYIEEEYFVSGTAFAYESATPLALDGRWTVTPVAPAAFSTRIIVRRPADPAVFSGNVAVEWFNVTAGFDTAPDWAMAHTEMIRSGWAWVGVSAQEVGIIGREDAIVPLALQQVDPERYGALSHPGDSYSYDIFSQIGKAVRAQSALLLAGLAPARLFAFGQSGSAMRLTTYVNAVAPLADVYDGYMIHSRGSHGSALSQEPLADVSPPDLTVVRTDLAVPVLTFITETDLVGERLGYAAARQPDSETIRTWEVPGTAHVDAYGLGIGDADDGSGVADDTLFAAMSAPSNLVYGGIITCDLPINAGPQTYVFRAAVAALANWVTSGEPPPTMPRIELDTSGAIVVDDNGNARGGIRTPQVDAPVAVLSGLGQAGDSFCGLFGTTAPFDAGQFSELYPDREAFLTAWNDAVDSAMTSGAMLAADGARLRAVAAARN